jgi:hypothetical protein
VIVTDPNGVRRLLDWHPRHDQRSLSFPMRELLPDAMSTLQHRGRVLWAHGEQLDQGSEGSCVGMAWMQEALTSPVRVDLLRSGYPLPAITVARGIYHEARSIDVAQGNNWPEGASVLSGAKVMTRMGWLREYRWCFEITEVIQTLVHRGPVVLGIPWLREMMLPSVRGELIAAGNVVGGHAILATGYDPAKIMHPSGDAFARTARSMVHLQNSWGRNWGQDGGAWIETSTLERLLDDNGEACVPTKRSYGRVVAQ